MASSVEEVRRLADGREGPPSANVLRKNAANGERRSRTPQPSPADFRIVGHPVLLLLIVALLSGFCGVVVNSRAFLVTVVVLAVLVLGLVLPTLTLLGLRGEVRYARRRGEVGKDMTVFLGFRRLWPWPIYGLLVRGGWTSRKKWRLEEAAVWSVPVLRGKRTVEVSATFVPVQRGAYPKTQAYVTTSFPLGLRWARRRLESRGHVMIWPAIVPLPSVVSFGASDGWSDAVDTRRAGTQGPWSGTRPYQPGEPLRKIHWRQTARHDQLIVCERSAPAGRGAQIVLETDPAVYQGPAGQRMREKAISAAASLALAMTHMGVRISAIMDNTQFFEATSPDELTAFLDALACLEADQGSRLAGLLGRPECHGSEGLTQILVTTRAGMARMPSSELHSPARRWLVVEANRAASGLPGDGRPEGSAVRRAAGTFLLPVSDPDNTEFHRLWKEMCREM